MGILDRNEKALMVDLFHLNNLITYSLNKTLIDRLLSCELLVYHHLVFINCLNSHSDGIHSLQRINW